jgi:hypothetical protein
MCPFVLLDWECQRQEQVQNESGCRQCGGQLNVPYITKGSVPDSNIVVEMDNLKCFLQTRELV